MLGSRCSSSHRSEPDDELLDSQLAIFIHGNLVKNYCKGITPSMTWLDSEIRGTAIA